MCVRRSDNTAARPEYGQEESTSADGEVTLRESCFRESGQWSREFIHGANCLAITYLLISETPMVPPHSYRVAAIAAN